jgi:hypothetical protein
MPGMLPEENLYQYWKMRDALPRTDPMQGMLGPMEHRQFTREAVQANPLMALPLAVATPFYTGAKALGMTNARSPASLDEIFASYHGITEGMLNHLVPSAQAHHEQSETVQRPDGKWINVYGSGLPQRGQQLPGTPVFDSMEEAVRAARGRSEMYRNGVRGNMPAERPAPPKRTPSDGVRG